VTATALVFLVALAVGWVARDLWDVCTELFDLYREEMKD